MLFCGPGSTITFGPLGTVAQPATSSAAAERHYGESAQRIASTCAERTAEPPGSRPCCSSVRTGSSRRAPCSSTSRRAPPPAPRDTNVGRCRRRPSTSRRTASCPSAPHAGVVSTQTVVEGAHHPVPQPQPAPHQPGPHHPVPQPQPAPPAGTPPRAPARAPAVVPTVVPAVVPAVVQPLFQPLFQPCSSRCSSRCSAVPAVVGAAAAAPDLTCSRYRSHRRPAGYPPAPPPVAAARYPLAPPPIASAGVPAGRATAAAAAHAPAGRHRRHRRRHRPAGRPCASATPFTTSADSANTTMAMSFMRTALLTATSSTTARRRRFLASRPASSGRTPPARPACPSLAGMHLHQRLARPRVDIARPRARSSKLLLLHPFRESPMAAEPRTPEAAMDAASLYREEIVTDRKVGTIRMMVPITADGAPDPRRPTVYTGEAQIMTNMGALPVSFDIEADEPRRSRRQVRRSRAASASSARCASCRSCGASRRRRTDRAARGRRERAGRRRPGGSRRRQDPAALAARPPLLPAPAESRGVRRRADTRIRSATVRDDQHRHPRRVGAAAVRVRARASSGGASGCPRVVLLIVTGLVARQMLDAIGLHLHWVEPIVPVIGTLGLILIVLEGALDLTVTRERHAAHRHRGGRRRCWASWRRSPRFALLFHFAARLRDCRSPCSRRFRSP